MTGSSLGPYSRGDSVKDSAALPNRQGRRLEETEEEVKGSEETRRQWQETIKLIEIRFWLKDKF